MKISQAKCVMLFLSSVLGFGSATALAVSVVQNATQGSASAAYQFLLTAEEEGSQVTASFPDLTLTNNTTLSDYFLIKSNNDHCRVDNSKNPITITFNSHNDCTVTLYSVVKTTALTQGIITFDSNQNEYDSSSFSYTNQGNILATSATNDYPRNIPEYKRYTYTTYNDRSGWNRPKVSKTALLGFSQNAMTTGLDGTVYSALYCDVQPCKAALVASYQNGEWSFDNSGINYLVSTAAGSVVNDDNTLYLAGFPTAGSRTKARNMSSFAIYNTATGDKKDYETSFSESGGVRKVTLSDNNKILYVAGWSQNQYNTNFATYNTENQVWSDNNAQYNAPFSIGIWDQVAFGNDRLYAIAYNGHDDGTHQTPQNFSYFQGGQWETDAKIMTSGLEALNALAVSPDGKMAYVGGWNSSDNKVFNIYDTQNRTWSEASTTPLVSIWAMGVATDGTLYAASGYNSGSGEGVTAQNKGAIATYYNGKWSEPSPSGMIEIMSFGFFNQLTITAK